MRVVQGMRGLTNGLGKLRLVIFLFLLGCTENGKQSVPATDVILAHAAELASKGFFTEAAKYVASFADSVPSVDRGKVKLEVARLYHKANVDDLALVAAEAAIGLGIKDPDVYYVQADCQRQLHLPGAEKTFEKLLQMAPGHVAGKLGLARFRLRSADPASALPLFESYFRSTSPSDPELKVAVLEHARALRNVGRYQEAADRFASLLEDDPLEGPFYSGLAEALYRLKLRKEAQFIEGIYKLISQNAFEEHVEDRLRETGATAFALGQRAVNRTRQRRYLDAFQSYVQALEVDQADPRLRTYYADLCIQLRRFSDARTVLDDAIRRGLHPTSGLWWMRGRTSLEEDDAPGSVAAFQSALKALQSEGDLGGQERGQAPPFSLYLALTRTALEAGDLALAAQAQARAAALSPPSWENAYWQGRIELASGDAGKALSLFADASKRGGQSLMDLRYWTAIALATRGQKDEAVAMLQQVQQSTPGFLPASTSLVGLAEGNPAVSGPAGAALAQLEALKREVKEKERLIDSTPLAGCGQHYLDLGKLGLQLKEPSAYDFLFIATDLLPKNAEACQLLLAGMKQPQDVFSRVRLLRRLLDLDPADVTAMRVLADIYLKLHVRLDEASRLAEKLHGAGPSAASYRLRGQAAILRGRRAEGLEILRAGQTAYPQDADLRDLLLAAEQSPADSPAPRSEH